MAAGVAAAAVAMAGAVWAAGAAVWGLAAERASGEEEAEVAALVEAGDEVETAAAAALRGQSIPGMQPPGRPRCCGSEPPLVQGQCRTCAPCQRSGQSPRPHFPASGTAHGWVRREALLITGARMVRLQAAGSGVRRRVTLDCGTHCACSPHEHRFRPWPLQLPTAACHR